MGHAEPKLQEQVAQPSLSLDAYWMPFTSNRDFKSDPKMIVRAEGVWLIGPDGRRTRQHGGRQMLPQGGTGPEVRFQRW